MTFSELIVDPFAQFAFMRRALAACVILSIGGTPLGVFMTLRRMTLMGDAMSHAILPGVAIAFAVAGLSLIPMALGGLAAGIAVASLVVFLTRFAKIKEDASMTLCFLFSLALGVVIVSTKGSNVDLLHMLFGNILAVDNDALTVMAAVACVTLFTVLGLYREIVVACFDPDFMALAPRRGPGIHAVFFVLLAINLIAAFLALGTLMALGLMILPAVAAKFWSRDIDTIVPLSVCLAVFASGIGLVVSYHTQIPAGASVVLTAGSVSFLSALFGRCGSVYAYVRQWG